MWLWKGSNFLIMQFISTKYHAIIDYLMGAALISIPFLFYTWDNSIAMQILAIAGGSVILYSLATRYEYSLFKMISMKFHLTLDIFVGLMLIISPWMFGFAGDVFMPHITFGILQIVIVAFSSTTRAHQLYTGPYHNKF
jgi:hypothetical protein